MVNFKELLGNNNQLQNLLLDTVEEGEVYRLCLTKEEGIIPKNKGDEGRKKFFVVVIYTLEALLVDLKENT